MWLLPCRTQLCRKQTLQAVRSISELQSKVVIGGAVGVQRPGHLPATDEAVLPAQHDDRAVDQLHDELLRLTWKRQQMCQSNVRSSHQHIVLLCFAGMLLMIKNADSLFSLKKITYVMQLMSEICVSECSSCQSLLKEKLQHKAKTRQLWSANAGDQRLIYKRSILWSACWLVVSVSLNSVQKLGISFFRTSVPPTNMRKKRCLQSVDLPIKC